MLFFSTGRGGDNLFNLAKCKVSRGWTCVVPSRRYTAISNYKKMVTILQREQVRVYKVEKVKYMKSEVMQLKARNNYDMNFQA